VICYKFDYFDADFVYKLINESSLSWSTTRWHSPNPRCHVCAG